MRYNDAVANEYGIFNGSLGQSPMPYKPSPSKKDYQNGYITRVFAQKRNDYTTTEISPDQSSSINNEMYKVVSLRWAISGLKYTTVKNNIREHQGTIDHNKYEIQKVSTEQEVDLTKALQDLSEFWRPN